jgi:hypothetical protein
MAYGPLARWKADHRIHATWTWEPRFNQQRLSREDFDSPDPDTLFYLARPTRLSRLICRGVFSAVYWPVKDPRHTEASKDQAWLLSTPGARDAIEYIFLDADSARLDVTFDQNPLFGSWPDLPSLARLTVRAPRPGLVRHAEFVELLAQRPSRVTVPCLWISQHCSVPYDRQAVHLQLLLQDLRSTHLGMEQLFLPFVHDRWAPFPLGRYPSVTTLRVKACYFTADVELQRFLDGFPNLRSLHMRVESTGHAVVLPRGLHQLRICFPYPHATVALADLTCLTHLALVRVERSLSHFWIRELRQVPTNVTHLWLASAEEESGLSRALEATLEDRSFLAGVRVLVFKNCWQHLPPERLAAVCARRSIRLHWDMAAIHVAEWDESADDIQFAVWKDV